MKTSQFTDARMAAAVRSAGAGTEVAEIWTRIARWDGPTLRR